MVECRGRSAHVGRDFAGGISAVTRLGECLVEIARIPEQIKGYGHVKERNLKAARTRWAELMAQYRDPQAARQVA